MASPTARPGHVDPPYPSRPHLPERHDARLPANTTPEIFGGADAGSTVQLTYTDPGCSGTVVGTGTASDFSLRPVSPVDPVADYSSTTYYATATDASAVVSIYYLLDTADGFPGS